MLSPFSFVSPFFPYCLHLLFPVVADFNGIGSVLFAGEALVRLRRICCQGRGHISSNGLVSSSNSSRTTAPTAAVSFSVTFTLSVKSMSVTVSLEEIGETER